MVSQLAELENADRRLFPPSLTIRALRDSRYHNTAYAIAELIDNSIEAGAESVELLCMESSRTVTLRASARVSRIAVLDNGIGMDVKTLFEALKFGGGSHHYDDRGISKYGMGLPTSSMSQCKRVDVWTWQNGLESVWHSAIDAEKIEEGDHTVPLPDQDDDIPEIWLTAGNKAIYENRSGTLVVWSNLDKIQWKTAHPIIENTAREVGRIHRYFINEDITRIRAISFRENRPSEVTNEKHIVANDPLYLMKPTSTPAPWDTEAMFSKWAEKAYHITVEGKEVAIEVKYSIVKPEALETDAVSRLPGATDYGRHARHNIGVSVIREDREIVLEDAFLREGGSSENPQNRWWGCEVHFRRSCDELFGLDHNKQMVANFTEAAKTLARDDRQLQRILDDIGMEGDPIYEIVSDIRAQTDAMMREIKKMFALRRPPKKPGKRATPEVKAAETASKADQEAMATGMEDPTDTDKFRQQTPPSDRMQGLTKQFMESGRTEQDAQQLAKMLVEEGLSYQFNPEQLDGSQIFRVRSEWGILHIYLNIDHPIYDLIKHVEGRLDEMGNEDDPAFQAIVAMRLLLASWARMEDQTRDEQERRRIQNTAIDWGRQVEKVITQLRERDG